MRLISLSWTGVLLIGFQIEANIGRSAKVVNPQAVSKKKSVNICSKKSNMAPWEAQDFARVKVEMTEDVSVNLSSKIEELPSDIVDDLSLPHVGILGDRYVDFLEPLKVRV